ncbi:unnamed protein product [Closterium sp. Naga37s-1]|nr:unnamed protein product [Closterium sp. Naga37s-1]
MAAHRTCHLALASHPLSLPVTTARPSASSASSPSAGPSVPSPADRFLRSPAAGLAPIFRSSLSLPRASARGSCIHPLSSPLFTPRGRGGGRSGERAGAVRVRAGRSETEEAQGGAGAMPTQSVRDLQRVCAPCVFSTFSPAPTPPPRPSCLPALRRFLTSSLRSSLLSFLRPSSSLSFLPHFPLSCPLLPSIFPLSISFSSPSILFFLTSPSLPPSLPLSSALSSPLFSPLPTLLSLLTRPSFPPLFPLFHPFLPLLSPSFPLSSFLSFPLSSLLFLLLIPLSFLLFPLLSPSLPCSFPLSPPSLPCSFPLSSPSLPPLFPLSSPSLPPLFTLSSPSLSLASSLSHPPLVPALSLSFPLSSPSLPPLFPLSSPSLPPLFPLSSPSLPPLFPLSSPTLPPLFPPLFSSHLPPTYAGLATAAVAGAQLAGLDWSGGFQLSLQGVLDGFAFSAPAIALVLALFQDRVAERWEVVRAVRDADDEEAEEFFQGMAAWQYTIVAVSAALSEELFFRAALQAFLTRALLLSGAPSLDAPVVGMAALTGCLPSMAPCTQFCAATLTAALAGTLHYAMALPRDAVIVVTQSYSLGELRSAMRAWHERQEHQKIYPPMFASLLSLYYGIEWVMTGNLVAPMLTHALLNLVILHMSLVRVGENRKPPVAPTHPPQPPQSPLPAQPTQPTQPANKTL